MLERISQGQYIRSDDMPDELYPLQQRSDKIVFSHTTALFSHGIAERTPPHPTLTIPGSSKLSPAAADGCRIYYVKPELHLLGECTTTTKMGHNVIVYDMERTICYILRSRNRIDNQVFAMAMKGYAARKGQNWNKLMGYSGAFRITKLLRQYLEVIVWAKTRLI